MHAYLLSSEWVRFAFVLGIAVSMVMYEKRHLTTGSIVVPGYIAVFILHPLVIVATFVNALATFAFVNHFLRRYVLLYGRTKFTILAVTSTAIQTVMLHATPSGPWLWESDVPLFVGVGYIVPALIAHDMARQGIRKTTTSVLAAGAIVATPIALAIAFEIPGVNELAPIEGYGQIAIAARWIPVAMALAVVGSWAVARNYGLRSGGFVGAAFAGMFMGNPTQVAIALGIAAITWLLVTGILMRHMILFGRRKFSSMLIISSMLSWWSLWIGDNLFGPTWQQNYGVGSLALTPLLLPGLLANDAQRTSPRRVLAGLALVASFTVSTTWWVQTTVETSTLDLGWKVLAATTAMFLFKPQLATLWHLTLTRTPFDGELVSRLLGRLQTIGRTAPVFALSEGELAFAAVPDHGSLSATPWEDWRVRHPDVADAAERWLDEQLQRVRQAVPSPAAIVGDLDRATASILAASLRSLRSAHMLHDQDQPTPSALRRRTPFDAGSLIDTISGSPAALRETSPGVPDIAEPTHRHPEQVRS
ncbi:MAG TPA: poly-gamma-glutamate biosynthesis protein PgsC/CapC [Ilumatobacter sp.]|nr:poly-gamma-glutamate biosynthesis protein PgsC/CapC [Ilumatobacter sp.]